MSNRRPEISGSSSKASANSVQHPGKMFVRTDPSVLYPDPQRPMWVLIESYHSRQLGLRGQLVGEFDKSGIVWATAQCRVSSCIGSVPGTHSSRMSAADTTSSVSMSTRGIGFPQPSPGCSAPSDRAPPRLTLPTFRQRNSAKRIRKQPTWLCRAPWQRRIPLEGWLGRPGHGFAVSGTPRCPSASFSP